MLKVFIDTDVILDFLFDRKPYSESAAKVLSLCEKGMIQGYITSITISNTYYLLRKVAKHQKVMDSLKDLLSFLNISITDKQTILDALNSEFKDFEDALQNSSAINSDNIQILLTRNSKDYKASNLSILSSEEFLNILP